MGLVIAQRIPAFHVAFLPHPHRPTLALPPLSTLLCLPPPFEFVTRPSSGLILGHNFIVVGALTELSSPLAGCMFHTPDAQLLKYCWGGWGEFGSPLTLLLTSTLYTYGLRSEVEFSVWG